MAIFDLGICPNLHLDVSRRFRYYLAKDGNLKAWNIHMFNWELTLRIFCLNCCLGSWNRFVMSFEIFVRNLRSFRVDLIWLSTSFRSWKFKSSLSLIWGVIRKFDVVMCDLRPRVSLCYIMGLVGMFVWGSKGFRCVSDWFQTILKFACIAGFYCYLMPLVFFASRRSSHDHDECFSPIVDFVHRGCDLWNTFAKGKLIIVRVCDFCHVFA